MSVTRTRQPAAIPGASILCGADGDGDPLEEKIEAYFARYGRPRRGARVLVALSGGADSVALLAALVRMRSKLGWAIGAAHVNYRLRGAESEEDHDFCRRLARRWKVRFHSLRPQRPNREPHANLQLWARDVRYRFFTRTAAAQDYDHIAVGHTLDDRAENVAAAVIDAAGTFALSGIPPLRGPLIRPLFGCTRGDVEAYLHRRRIPCRRDSSNRSLRYRRNQVRKHVLPQWTAMNPAVVEGLARLGEQLWLQRRYLEEAAGDILRRAVKNGGEHRLTLAADELREYDRCLDPFVLRAVIERIGLSLVPRPATVARFEELRRETNGTACTVEQGDLTITRSKGTIAVARRVAHRRPETRRIAVPRSGLTVSALDHMQLRTDILETVRRPRFDDTRVAYFDLAGLEGPLVLRRPCPGDRYRPIGLGGSKKLTDLLSERAVPAFDRENIPVLADRSGILWPIGCPIAHRARVTGGTQRILRVRVVKK